MADFNEYSDHITQVFESGDQLTITNRSKTYCVSKKFICSSIPYFQSMFCSDLLEAKENRVELDLEEHSFNCILNWIHSESAQIEMERVIALFDAADYLMLNDLPNDCYSYFHANFTIEHLPIIIPQVTKTSKLINSGALNTFICRHFLKIVKTSIFLNYPVETVEYICGLDLMVSSEYQVLEAINDWIKAKSDDRKKYLLQLLRCIRWCYAGTDASSKIMEVPYIATIQDINEILCSPGHCKLKCTSNRTDQCSLISIRKIDDRRLCIRVLQSQFWLPVGFFNLDDSMSLELVHGENISDVLYDCGTKGVRIDWEAKKFRWLNFESDESYYLQINKLIVSSQAAPSTILYLEDKCGGYADDPFIELFHLRSLATSRGRIPAPNFSDQQPVSISNAIENDHAHLAFLYAISSQSSDESAIHDVPSTIPLENDERLLLESGGKFIVVGKTKDKKFYALFPIRHLEWATDCFLEDKDAKLPDSVLQDKVILKSDNKFIVIGKTEDKKKWFDLFPVKHKSWFNNYRYLKHSFHATVLDNVVYILTKDLEFIQFNYQTRSFDKSKPFKDEKLDFNDLILTSHQTHDDKVILVNKSTGKVYVFCINQKKWIEKYRIMNVNLGSNSPNAPVDELIVFTSTFLPMKVVKPLYKHTLL
ncbi:uncharacterized protein LOC107360924 [Tetranychus urticae]|uniref:uncharacterized protein LOC107360924 n=1 Tax=Tetranychus urticae TaxID=32264 RepID=UPI00077BCD61|nr:uncharacterized protein LOC107360924 [Tetranychus urticae]